MQDKLDKLKNEITNKTSLYIEYAEKYIKYKQEYNTDKFIFYMQVGSFYENYSWEVKDENFFLFDKASKKTANILNMIRSYKSGAKKHSYDNPRMYGFPTVAAERHIERLLEEGYTIVIIGQRDAPDGKKKIRDIVNRYTPGTDTNNRHEDNYIMNIIIDEYKNNKKNCGVSLININANDNYYFECCDTDYDKNNVINNIVKIILQFRPVEYVIYNHTSITDNLLVNLLNINNETYMIKKHILADYKNIEWQSTFLDRIYGRDSLLNSIDKMNLGNLPDARLSYTLLLKYVQEQNKVLIKNIKYPRFINFENSLNLDYNTAEQLNIIGSTKFDRFNILSLLDFTSTNMGKRMLKRNIMAPSAKIEDIKIKHELIEEMLNKKNYKKFEVELEELPDITKKHKKIFFESIIPQELYELTQSYEYIIKLLDLTINNPKLKQQINNYQLSNIDIQNYILQFKNKFNEENIKRCRDIQEITYNIFKEDQDKELNEYVSKLKGIENYRKILKYTLDTFFLNNIGKYDTKYDKNCLFISKSKMTAIKKQMKNNILEIEGEQFYHKVLNKKDYLTTDKLEKMNRKEATTLDKLRIRTEELYTQYLKDLCKYSNLYDSLDEVVSLIDYIKSGVKCAKTNHYIKPIIDEEEKESYFDIQGIRHPIIENVNTEIPFISNDIKLDNKNKGMIISGINGIGKSSLLKNVGINIVIAQSGYYVPCKYMKFVPFTSILTRIKGNDNIYTNSSSYTVEIQELSNILKKANNKSLILIDELSKGTEVASAHALTIAIIKNLIKEKQSRFILTSHLHSIFKNDIIQDLWNNKDILIKHLSMDIREDEIVYTRKLTDGPSKTEYGLEIAKTLGIDSNIINEAIKIRDDFLNISQITTTKQSLYNNNVYMNSCEICGSKEQLETHHIIEQKDADEDGYILDKNFHKNDKHNLSVLCKECHKKITFGKIKMTQRVMTTNGPRFEIIKLETEEYDIELIGKKISDYRMKRISWKSIPKLLKNKYDIELTIYKCKQIFNEYIK